MNHLQPLPHATPGRYRHYKGNEYELIALVRHSETLEPMVLYRPLKGDTGQWVRPYGHFFSQVLLDGQWQPRFERVGL